jgi:hypothetical protein
MVIPSKHSGYQAGIRLYPSGSFGSTPNAPLTGADYNRRLQAGETSQSIRDSTKGLFGTGMSDANWGAMVQDAGMNSPTGRPMAGSDQFFQPVYKTAYQNYAQPNTQANVSMYGTYVPPQQQSARPLGGFDPELTNTRNASLTQFNDQMPSGGSLFGGGFGGGNMMVSDMQYRGPTQSQQQGFSGFGQQMQSPFSFQQPSYQPQPQMQSPFSFQQPVYQQQSFQQPVYQQQSYQQPSFQQPSFQQPSYQQQPAVQPMPQRTSSGPTSAIVGRSAGFRGTPSVMRRAEGGITSLMDDVE